MIIDAWMQHPSAEFLTDPMFDSLRRWSRGQLDQTGEVPVEAPYTASRYPRELADYLRGHGRRKVLFGSNHPAWPAADCLEDLPGLQLDDETTGLFLHGNAERVFGLPCG